jgi:hypothetical protein
MNILEKELLLHGALALHREGYEVELLRYGTKKAVFEAWNTRGGLSGTELSLYMRRRPHNVAVRLGREVRGPPGRRLMVVDVDADEGWAWVKEHQLDSPMQVRTAKGVHLYFAHDLGEQRTRIKYLGLPIDLKFTGYAVAPASVVDSFRYEFLQCAKPEALKLFPPDLLKEEPKPRPTIEPRPWIDRDVEAMRRWIRKVRAIEGQGNDRHCYRVALKICSVVHDERQALAELVAWNSEGYADPPFTEKEMLHKVRCALNYLLGVPK